MSGGRGGHGALTLALAVAVIAGGIAVDHTLGVRSAGVGPASTTDSGAWLCPHGGGRGWQGRLYLANPGSRSSKVRVTALSAKGSDVIRTLTVDPGTTTELAVPATAPEASTYVEYFGGWVAAGWMTVSTAVSGTGIGAEPCAPASDARTWFTANGGTPKGAGANIVIMNPYGAEAIFDVVLFSADRAPVRESSLTDKVLEPGRSMVVPIGTLLPLESAVGSEIAVHAGRIAVASIETSTQNGVAAVLGSTAAQTSTVMPVLAGNGQRSVSVVVPGTSGARFAGASLGQGSQPIGGLSDIAQNPQSAQSYTVVTAGASAIRLTDQQGGQGTFVSSAYSLGQGSDISGTWGAPPGPSWVVLPTVAGDPSTPGLVVTDPGTAAVTVTLHVLSATGPSDVTMTVSAGSSSEAPASFLAADPNAGILVTATSGAVIATGASESLGTRGVAGYAVAVGVPVPQPR